MLVHSVSWLLWEYSTTFEPVLCLNECVCHPVVSNFLSIAKSSLPNPWRGSIPKSGWAAETGPFVETEWTIFKVRSCPWSSCKHKQSPEGSCTESQTNCAETALSSKKISLAEKMPVWLGNNFIGCVVICAHGFKAGVVPLVDAPESVSWHY